MTFKDLNQLKKAVKKCKNKDDLYNLNAKCGWDNCAIGCRLKELDIFPKAYLKADDAIYHLLSTKAVAAGMRFNDALKADKPDKALEAIDAIRKMEEGFFKASVKDNE